jgi:hypothetical protein
MSALRSVTTEQAIAVLFEDAGSDPARVRALLQEAGQRDPNGITALLKAAGLETLGDVSIVPRSGGKIPFPLVIGQPVTEQGIPLSRLRSGDKIINLDIIPDFLKDISGNTVEMEGNDAIKAITSLNGGVKYGNGYEKAITQAVAKGEFKDGTLILARRSDLGILARRSDLLKIFSARETKPALEQMNENIASGSSSVCWCVSSTENRANSSNVHHVRLQDNFGRWSNKDVRRSRVVVLRGVNCN